MTPTDQLTIGLPGDLNRRLGAATTMSTSMNWTATAHLRRVERHSRIRGCIPVELN
jgi:hypothetical protein